MSSVARDADVVVVGAGAAGIAAARALREAGVETVVVEAAHRIGGRAHTDLTTFGVPFDRGCHWLHSASINPMVDEAAAHGLTVVRREWQPHVHDGKRWLEPTEREALVRYFRRSLDTVEAAGAKGLDVAAATVLDAAEPWYPLLAHWITAISGSEPDCCSTRAWAEDDDTAENWPTLEGYGTLVARIGAGLPVRTGVRVDTIDSRGRDVQLVTSGGELRARAVVVTVSNGVLASGRIRFTPALPPDKTAALAGIPMGIAEKIALGFDRDVFGLGESAYAILAASAPDTMGFQIRPGGQLLAIGYAAGRHAAALVEAGEAAAVECAVEQLSAMFGSGVRAALGPTAVTGWVRDPLFLGSYSAARPGCAHLRPALAAPIDGRLFFAGEATSAGAFSTAHGAYQSGLRAAVEVKHSLAR